jgi:hypothetical protein
MRQCGKIWYNGKATDGNKMRKKKCMSDNYDKNTLTHSLITVNIYCFSMATMVKRTHLNVTLHVRFLSGYHLRNATHMFNIHNTRMSLLHCDVKQQSTIAEYRPLGTMHGFQGVRLYSQQTIIRFGYLLQKHFITYKAQ